MSKLIIACIILFATAVVFSLAVLVIKVWSGRPFRMILADRRQLFLFSLKIAIALLVAIIVALVIRNN